MIRMGVSVPASCASAVIALMMAAAPAAQSDASAWEAQALTRLAIDTAADGAMTPIEMKAADRVLIAVYDRFRLAALAARAAIAAGHPLDPDDSPKALSEARTVIVAFSGSPLGDGPPVQSIDLRGRDGKAAKRLKVLKQADLAEWLPGVTVPGDAMVVAFAVPSLRPGDRIKLQSSASAMSVSMGMPGQVVPGASDFGVQFSAPEQRSQSGPVVPSGVTLPSGGASVTVQGVLDLTGHVRYARALDGPASLHAAAVDAVSRWVYTPARMWGAPVPLVMEATVQVR